MHAEPPTSTARRAHEPCQPTPSHQRDTPAARVPRTQPVSPGLPAGQRPARWEVVLRLHVQHRLVPGWSSGKTNSNLLVTGIPRYCCVLTWVTVASRRGLTETRGGAVTGARARQTETPCPRARAVTVLWPCPHPAQLESRSLTARATSPQRDTLGVRSPPQQPLPSYHVRERREAGGAHGGEGGGVAGHEVELACCLVQEEVEAVGYGGSGLAGGGGQGGGPGVVDDVEHAGGQEGALRLSVARRGRLRRRGRSISAGLGGRGGCRRG